MWNPYSYCGMSQLAVPSPSALYAPNLIFAFLPFTAALAATQIFHQVVAGSGIYLLSRTLDWKKLPSALAGIAMALGGFNFALAQNYTIFATTAWLPICIAFLLRLGRPGGNRHLYFIGTAITYALMVLAGRPEIWIVGSLALALSVIYSGSKSVRKLKNHVPDFRKRVASTISWQLAALFCGLLLATPALLPTAEWTAMSNRASGLGPKDVLVWSASWFDYFGIFLCQPLGDMGANGNPFLPLIATRQGSAQFIQSLYLGPATVTLALWGLQKTRRYNWVLPILLLLSMLLASGSNTPFSSELVSQVSFLRIFRYPIKLAYFVNLLIVLLAARGLNTALGKPSERSNQKISVIFWSVIVAATFQILQSHGQVLNFSARPFNAAILNQASIAIGVQLGVALAIGLATCALRYLYERQTLSKRWFCSSLLILVVAPLTYSAFQIRSTAGSPDFYGASQLKQIMQAHKLNQSTSPRLFTVDINEWGPSKNFRKKLHASHSEEAMQFERQLAKPNTNMDFAIQQTFGYEAAVTSTYEGLVYSAIRADSELRQKQAQRITREEHNTNHPGTRTETAGEPPGSKKIVESSESSVDLPLYRVCRATASGSVLTRSFSTDDFGNKGPDYPKLDSTLFELIENNDDLNIKLYRVLKPAPRAYLPRTWKWSNSRQEVKTRLIASAEPAADPLECSYISDVEPLKELETTEISSVVPDVSFTVDEPEHVQLKVTTDKKRLLVLADTVYPGWEASIDHEETQILRVNAINRGVFVPPGTHTIDFTFFPNSFKLGLALAGLSILAIIALSVALAGNRKAP